MLATELTAAAASLSIMPALRREIGVLDPELVPFQIATLADDVAHSLMPVRTSAILLGVFAGFTVALAAVGLYGLLAYGVSRRRGEIGIRVALGATRAGIVRLVIHEASWLLVAGLGVGLVLTIAAARAASAMLYGLSPGDPATLAAGALTLAFVAATASAIPAWRAARVDPSRAIREE